MNNLKVTWDVNRPPSTIHQVWDYLSLKLREERDKFRYCLDEFYGKNDRMAYVSTVNDSLKVCTDCCKDVQHVGTYMELEALMKISTSETIRPRQLQRAQEFLKTFADKTKIVMAKLTETRRNVEEDILNALEMYCSKYNKLDRHNNPLYI